MELPPPPIRPFASLRCCLRHVLLVLVTHYFIWVTPLLAVGAQHHTLSGLLLAQNALWQGWYLTSISVRTAWLVCLLLGWHLMSCTWTYSGLDLNSVFSILDLINWLEGFCLTYSMWLCWLTSDYVQGSSAALELLLRCRTVPRNN